MELYAVDRKAEEMFAVLFNKILIRKADSERLHLKKKITEI